MRLSSFWFTGKEKADFWRKHSPLSHWKHALALSLIFLLHMLLILQLLCGCCLMHFVFTPVMFNDICIEHFSKYCVKKILILIIFIFLTECHLQEQNSRKKRVTCSFNPRITWQINSCLPHSCKNLSTIPAPHRLQFYFYNCIQEANLRA